MAKFRRNYQSKRGANRRFLLLVLLLFMFIGGFIWLTYHLKTIFLELSHPAFSEPVSERIYLPNCKGTLIHHSYYSFCFSPKKQRVLWTAYSLDSTRLHNQADFSATAIKPDPKLPKMTLNHPPKVSEWTKAQWIPAKDLAFSEKAVMETFYKTNIVWQKNAFHAGPWHQLEERARELANRYSHTYIISGPVYQENDSTRGGGEANNQNPSFFKIILARQPPEVCVESYLLPHTATRFSREDHQVSIDQLEIRTGLDFFPEYLSDYLEVSLEKRVDNNCKQRD